MTADRPATEPRTEAGWQLAALNSNEMKWASVEPDEVRRLILAIEAEAAQDAAPRADVLPHSCASVEQEVELLSARNDSLVAELQHVKDSPAWKQLSRALQDRITRAIESRR